MTARKRTPASKAPKEKTAPRSKKTSPRKSSAGAGTNAAATGPRLFTPAQWKGRRKADVWARAITSGGTRGSLYEIPAELRNEADFIGPLLLCHGLEALIGAGPAVQQDPDILRLVFSRTYTSANDPENPEYMLDSLSACLQDPETGLRGPATMTVGERRTFDNDGYEITVLCLAREETRLGRGAPTVVTRLLLWCSESDNYEMDNDIAALEVTARLKGVGKSRAWQTLGATLRTKFNNVLPEESHLQNFTPANGEWDGEFDFEDDEDDEDDED